MHPIFVLKNRCDRWRYLGSISINDRQPPEKCPVPKVIYIGKRPNMTTTGNHQLIEVVILGCPSL
jgi:hypothetical protein